MNKKTWCNIVVDQKKIVAKATKADAKLAPAKLMAGAEFVGLAVEEAPVLPVYVLKENRSN